jgi:hypothetical protein
MVKNMTILKFRTSIYACLYKRKQNTLTCFKCPCMHALVGQINIPGFPISCWKNSLGRVFFFIVTFFFNLHENDTLYTETTARKDNYTNHFVKCYFNFKTLSRLNFIYSYYKTNATNWVRKIVPETLCKLQIKRCSIAKVGSRETGNSLALILSVC